MIIIGSRVTKPEIYQYLRDICYKDYGVVVSEIVRIDEIPNYIRHSCVNTGVILLNPITINITIRENYMVITFYICRACGKLYLMLE